MNGVYQLNALDYSTANPVPASMAAGGIKLVSRYLWSTGPGFKGLSGSERDRLHAAGIGVNANYEARAGMVLEGSVAARGHAQRAVGYAHALEWPANLSIDFSVDRDLSTQAEFTELGRFFEQVNAHRDIYRVGAYGEYDVLDWLFSRGLITHGWQTIAWSNHRVHPKACLYQFSVNNYWGGQSVDFNTVLHSTEAFAAAWMPYPPAPPIQPAQPGESGSSIGDASPILVPPGTSSHTITEDDMTYEIIQNAKTGALRAVGPGFWRALEGSTAAETAHNVAVARSRPLCANSGVVSVVSDQGMTELKDFYLNR